ncbi:MAG: hypothetical protein AAFR91_11080 [Pseudomonadota bacterium]
MTSIRGFAICAAILLGINSAPAFSEEEIARFKGRNNGETRTFTVDGPWLLDWRVNSDYRNEAGFELRLLDASTGRFHSQIMKIRGIGNGLKLFEEEGRFKFEVVSSFTDWTLKVITLTEDEAATYSPVDP